MRVARSIAFGWLLALPVFAGAIELRAIAGADLLHKQGMVMGGIKAGPLFAALWDNGQGNGGVGLAYDLGGETGWRAELGAMVVRRADDDVGTPLNFLLRGGYCWKRLCGMYTHISHGSSFGISPEAANSGLNFLSLEWRL